MKCQITKFSCYEYSCWTDNIDKFFVTAEKRRCPAEVKFYQKIINHRISTRRGEDTIRAYPFLDRYNLWWRWGKRHSHECGVRLNIMSCQKYYNNVTCVNISLDIWIFILGTTGVGWTTWYIYSLGGRCWARELSITTSGIPSYSRRDYCKG